MSFSQMNLDAHIFKALNACGYNNPTPIQASSIPSILTGKDLVASAQTGTGKTAAFVLPALQRLTLKSAMSKPRVLILTPTRELATQITQAASKYGKFLRFNIISLVGGMPYRQQLRDLSRPVDIIVATPGRLLDHMSNGRLNLSAIEMLILDEADRMLDMGFIDDVKEIAKATPENRQTLLFSATVDNKLSGIIRQLLKNPVHIDLSQEKMAPTLIQQEVYMADSFQHKERLLQHFLENENIFKAIIFSATKIHADKLAGQLIDMGYSAAALHGDLKQNVRNRTVEQLRRGKIQFLVATDVAARGIDINDVTHVINYDLPKFAEDYVHRIGRTGRAGKEGIAISFVLPSDAKHLQKIERYIGQKLTFSTIAGLEPKKRASAPSKSAAHSKKKSSRKPEWRKSDSRKGDSFKSDSYKSDSRRSDARKSDSFKSDSRRSDARKSDSFQSDSRRSDARKSDSFKSDSRRSDARKSDSFKSDSRRSDARKSDSRRSDARKSDPFKSDSRRSDARKSDSFKSDSRKPDARKSDSFKSDSRKPDARKSDSFKSDARKSDSRKADSYKSGARKSDSRKPDFKFAKSKHKKSGKRFARSE